MNILQLLGTIIYAVSLVAIMARTISEKKGEFVNLTFCLVSGIILCSANGGLNLKIAASLSIFAALLVFTPLIQLRKKGKR